MLTGLKTDSRKSPRKDVRAKSPPTLIDCHIFHLTFMWQLWHSSALIGISWSDKDALQIIRIGHHFRHNYWPKNIPRAGKNSEGWRMKAHCRVSISKVFISQTTPLHWWPAAVGTRMLDEGSFLKMFLNAESLHWNQFLQPLPFVLLMRTMLWRGGRWMIWIVIMEIAGLGTGLFWWKCWHWWWWWWVWWWWWWWWWWCWSQHQIQFGGLSLLSR